MKALSYFKILFQCCLFFCLVTKSLDASIDSSKYAELEQCLRDEWGVDIHTNKYLLKKFQWLVENTGGCGIVDDFIAISKKQNIDFATSRDVQPLPIEDATLKDPNHHLILFENLYVRILWGSTLPQEREPIHLHAWKSVMLTLKPAIYLIEYTDGKTEILHSEVGVYELPSNETYGCTNISNEPDEIIRFEIKE